MAGFPIITAQVKDTEKYTLRVPDDSEDLHLQIHFVKPFKALVASKHIYKIEREIKAALEASDIDGEFELEIVLANESMYLGSPGFWQSLTSSIEELLVVVEGVLNKYL